MSLSASMNRADEDPRSRSDAGRTRLLLLSLVLFGLGLRIFNLAEPPELWVDEIYSVAFAESPLLDVVLATLRFDTHPPLYYLQLHLWGLIDRSDFWYLVNPMLLNVVAGIALFLTARRHYGEAVALWALALFAIVPQQVFFADNVRMYGLAAIWTILLWDQLERIVAAPREGGRGRLLLVFLLAAALTMTHGLGFFVAFFVVFQAALRVWLAPEDRAVRIAALRGLVLGYGPAALLAGYSLAVSFVRETVGVDVFSLREVSINLTIALLGHEFPRPAYAGALAVAMFFVPPLFFRASRPLVILLVLLPLGTLLAVSIVAKPIFFFRTIGLFGPFILLAAAIAIDRLWRTGLLARGAVAAALLIVVANSVNNTLYWNKSDFRGLTTAWDRAAEPDAVLFVGRVNHFWGIIRYLDGAEPQSALAVQPPPTLKLQNFLARAGSTLPEELGLLGQSTFVDVGSRRVFPGAIEHEIALRQRFWILPSSRGSCEDYHAVEVQRVSHDSFSILACERRG